MAKTKTGASSIIRLVRKICSLVGRFGAADLAAKTSAEYAAAVFTLVTVCAAFEAADDYPGQIDATAPFGPGDVTR